MVGELRDKAGSFTTGGDAGTSTTGTGEPAKTRTIEVELTATQLDALRREWAPRRGNEATEFVFTFDGRDVGNMQVVSWLLVDPGEETT